MDDKKIIQLQDSAMMALGWMTAKAAIHPHEDLIIVALARSLKAAGVDSTYVDAIVAAADAPSSKVRHFNAK